MNAFKVQVSFFVGQLTRMSNRSQEAYSKTAPDPLRSLLVQGCIEKGRDVKSGGPIYNHGQVLIQGIGNTADSFAVIEKLVFREGRLSMDRLVSALNADWEGFETERTLAGRCPKYGNDDDSVDRFAAEAVEHCMSELKRYRTFRGGFFGGGSSVFVRGITFGSHVGATPDGRKSGQPLADSVGPVQGKDRLGPTAALGSVAKTDLTMAVSGYVLNLKLSRSLFDASGLDRLIALVQGYFTKGGQQVQIAVLDGGELRKAQDAPDAYRNLIVRVGGFSDYFVNLNRELQDEIISRTEHAI
jgi:formate C-acetyltransferase